MKLRFPFVPVRSFGAKVTLLITLTSGLAVALVSGLTIGIQHLDLRRETMKFVTAQVNSVSINCEAPLDFDDAQSAGKALASLRAVPEIASAVLYKQDQVFATYHRARGPQPNSPVELAASGGDRHWMVFSSPVATQDATAGRVEVIFDTTNLRERLRASIMLTLAEAGLAMVVVFLIATRVRQVLARPVAELAATALRVSHTRDYAIRAEKYGEDELGQLTDNFNEMMDQIQRKDAEIQQAHNQREAVLERERSARAEAERVSRMKDEFVATLSHELRTPLTAILGWAQMMRRPNFDARENEQGLEIIERNARVQTQIIEDLLDMSRIISGKIRLDVQRINLVEVIEAAMSTVRPAAEAKNIRLHDTLDPTVGMVRADPGRLRQVLWNLISNAIKFTGRDGRVEVSLTHRNGQALIVVRDTGQGIKPEFLPFVFDRFRQADSSSTRRHGGLGLGLAIVKQLVELHGGSVRAHSEGEGQGSAFHLEFPLAGPVETSEPDESPSDRSKEWNAGTESTARLNEIRVLVVDDEPDARSLVMRILRNGQASVMSAGSVEEAMEIVRTHRPHVIVSDIGMPGEDGYSLIRRVRGLSDAQLAGTPAIALTAFARSEDRTRALLAGYQMHLSKPVEPSELTVTVASLAGRHTT